MTPRQVSKLRILDPACGSGSFLVGAFRKLLDYHRDWYVADGVEKHKKEIYQGAGGRWLLTTEEKKRILLNNIFGVDIDPQAVEVTKLNLLLCVLENENQETINQLVLFQHKRALPDLASNIKCGNSLIGSDFYEGKQTTMFDEETRYRINAFDWDREFPQVFPSPPSGGEGKGEGHKGGFDVVIGNPPYVRQEVLGDQFKEYAARCFSSYTTTADLYVYFVEQSHKLLREGGFFSMICSNKFMRSKYGVGLRSFLTTNACVLQILDFGELPVFKGVGTFPAILVTRKVQPGRGRFTYAAIKRLNFQSLETEVQESAQSLEATMLGSKTWTLSSSDEIGIIETMKSRGLRLADYVGGEIYRGILTGFDQAFKIDDKARREIVESDPQSGELLKPFLNGREVRRYCLSSKRNFLIVIPNGWTRRRMGTARDPWKWFCEKHPGIALHLEQYQNSCRKRYDKGEFWWELRSCDYYPEFEKPKIVWPEIAKEPRAHLDQNGLYFPTTVYILPRPDKYLLGVLNAKATWFFLQRTCSVLGDINERGRLRLKRQYISELPIPSINFSDPGDKARHDRMVELVEAMLDLHKRLAGAKTPDEKTRLEREITATDNQIDKLVYQLYALTEEEITIVEQGAKE